MDTVGTFEIAAELAKHRCFTTIHKHYSIEEWIAFADGNKRDENVSLVGNSEYAINIL